MQVLVLNGANLNALAERDPELYGGMNEVKADVEAVVRKVCVENAQPVEYGQLLFELEPLNGRPLDAL